MNSKLTRLSILAFIFVLFPATDYAAASSLSPSVSAVWQTVKTDYNHFYSKEQWKKLGMVFGLGGVMANTKADQEIQDWYQNRIRNSSSDDLAAMVKGFGDWKYLVPVSLAATGIGFYFPQGTGGAIGTWGERTFRAYVVAAPAMFLGQHLTGASRPDERENASHWRPFSDNNGVSGHAFVGAVPFITMAKMITNPYIRYAVYAASMLSAWSRVNDNAHFTSQVMLGWSIGYAAADTVSSRSSNTKKATRQFGLLPWKDGAVARINYQW